jgi:hypothetical protein
LVWVSARDRRRYRAADQAIEHYRRAISANLATIFQPTTPGIEVFIVDPGRFSDPIASHTDDHYLIAEIPLLSKLHLDCTAIAGLDDNTNAGLLPIDFLTRRSPSIQDLLIQINRQIMAAELIPHQSVCLIGVVDESRSHISTRAQLISDDTIHLVV